MELRLVNQRIRLVERQWRTTSCDVIGASSTFNDYVQNQSYTAVGGVPSYFGDTDDLSLDETSYISGNSSEGFHTSSDVSDSTYTSMSGLTASDLNREKWVSDIPPETYGPGGHRQRRVRLVHLGPDRF